MLVRQVRLIDISAIVTVPFWPNPAVQLSITGCVRDWENRETSRMAEPDPKRTFADGGSRR